jgi:hypothetical protein
MHMHAHKKENPDYSGFNLRVYRYLNNKYARVNPINIAKA